MAFGKAGTVGKPAAGAPRGLSAGKPLGGKPNGAAAGATGAGGTRYISIKASDQQAGGLLDDVDAILQELTFCTWDYNGQQEPQLALRVRIVADDGQEAEQYFSAGKLERMIPTDDGERITAAPGCNSVGLNDSTNAAAFIRSLQEHGFPDSAIDEANGAISVFAGTYCHLNRVAQKKRGGLVEQEEGRPKTVLLCTAIHRFPWEAAAGGKTAPKNKVTAMSAGKKPLAKAPAAPPADTQASSNGAGDALETEAAAAVLDVLTNNNGQIAKKVLAMQVFRTLGQSPNRSAILNLVGSDDFLMQEGAPWQYDGTTLSVAE